MKTKSILKFLPLILVASMFGCSLNNSEQLDYSSLKSVLKFINTHNNYTIEQENKKLIIYEEDSYYYKDDVEEFGYIECNDGIYRLDKIEDSYAGSKLLKDKNDEAYKKLYSQTDLVYSFKDIDFDFENFDNQQDKYVLSTKKNIMNYLNIMGEDLSMIPLVVNITFTLVDENVKMELLNRDGSLTYSYIKDINKSENAIIDAYKEDGTYYVNSNDENRIIELFSGFNYKRVCLDVDNVTPIGYEWYNPRYFYGEWEDEYYQQHVGEIYEIGVIGFSKLQYQNYYLDGSYYFNYDEKKQEVSVITTQPINTNPDVTKVYNYPTYMSLFEKFHLFKVDENYENTIYTNDYNLMNEFCVNFQIAEVLNENNCSLESLEIAYEMNELDKECMVWFNLYYEYNNMIGAFSYPFTEFGNANIELVDNFILELEGGVKNE